jgi:hypothetical protein
MGRWVLREKGNGGYVGHIQSKPRTTYHDVFVTENAQLEATGSRPFLKSFATGHLPLLARPLDRDPWLDMATYKYVAEERKGGRDMARSYLG